MCRRLALIVLAVGLSPGCAFIKPTTEITFDPLTHSVRVFNTKDVNVIVDDLKVTWDSPNGNEFSVTKLEISDLSSPVIEKNVQQMLAFVEQQKAANEGIIGSLRVLGDSFNFLANVVRSILQGSNIQLSTPYGGGSATLGTTPSPTEGGATGGGEVPGPLSTQPAPTGSR